MAIIKYGASHKRHWNYFLMDHSNSEVRELLFRDIFFKSVFRLFDSRILPASSLDLQMLTLGSLSNLKSFRPFNCRIFIYFKFKVLSSWSFQDFFDSLKLYRYCSWNLLLRPIKNIETLGFNSEITKSMKICTVRDVVAVF